MSEETLRFTGELRVDVSTTDADRAAVDGRTADALVVGEVATASGTGLAGLRVTVAPADGQGRGEVLAEALTDGGGSFRVALVGFGALTDLLLTFRVADGQGSVLLEQPVDVALTGGRGRVVLTVALPETQVPPDLLPAVAAGAAESGIDRLDLLVGALSSAAGGPFDGVPLPARQAVVDQLEQAFLDPTRVLSQVAGPVPSLRNLQDPDVLVSYLQRVGEHASPEVARAAGDLAGKAASFPSLLDVDWAISVDDLRHGDLAGALHHYADRYRVGIDVGVGIDPHWFDTHTSDRIRYRDYLRNIWTGAASQVLGVNQVHLSETQARQQLERRFHQDFRTVDDVPRPANEVAAEILTAILLAPTGGGFGFGLAAAAIPALGDGTAREHLDALIALSGLAAAELTARYRLDLGRPDSAVSSPVDENITALQGFLRDTFQSGPEPDHVGPDVLAEPIVPGKLQGHAPFFLYYEEWLEQQRAFHGENFLDVRRLVGVVMGKADRDALDQRAFHGAAKALGPGGTDYTENWKLVAAVLAVTDALEQGHTHFHNGEYPLADTAYASAHGLAIDALGSSALGGLNMAPEIAKRRNVVVKDMPTLRDFEQMLRNNNANIAGVLVSSSSWPTDMGVRLLIVSLYVLPICRGDVALATGDYARAVFLYGQATRFAIGMARLSDPGGYKAAGSGFGNYFEQYMHGDLPYTAVLDGDQRASSSPYPIESDSNVLGASNAIENRASSVGTTYAHPVEKKLFKLRQGNAMLEWADSLYRTDEPPNIQRARELYKSVLWLWGETPPVVPHWPQEFPIPPTLFKQGDENPAIVSQKQRARVGLYKVDAGLNYFGETGDLVPALRFRALKEQADRMAASAKAAQLDFIQATERVESALVEQMRLTTLVEKSTLQVAIGTEQIAIAIADVEVAKEQVAAVEAQIKAKQAEIAKADSLFSQFSDFAGGLVKTFTSLPNDTKSAIGAGVTSEATGQAMVGEGMLGLGAGASVLAGFGVFAVAGYVTMSGMADAANARVADLATLRDKALPAAQRALVSRQHGQRVAELQKRIAEADLDLAKRLIAFEQDKLLNLAFWVNIAQVARRLMRRYLDMGARLAWLAERALSYEQDRPLRLVRLDYHLERLQGVTGADLLQADLAEVELARIEGLKRTAPVTRTVSLARDFPLAYGQLKATGRCAFRTVEAEFRRAYPGTNSYRIRAVSVRVSQAELSGPLRGALVNQGVSVSRPGAPDAHVLVRPAELLPISEFRLRSDLDLYGLPDETLLPFEGSAIESFWELEFPAAGNAGSLDSLLDVEITFDLRVQFDPHKRAADLAALPTATRRWVLLSAATLEPAAMASLRAGAGVVTLSLPVDRLALPAQEHDRTVTNAAVIAVDRGHQTFDVTVEAVTDATTVPVTLADGFASSTRSPDPAAPPLPAAALDAVAGLRVDQPFLVVVDVAAQPGVDFGEVRDVVLALEYDAKLV